MARRPPNGRRWPKKGEQRPATGLQPHPIRTLSATGEDLTASDLIAFLSKTMGVARLRNTCVVQTLLKYYVDSVPDPRLKLQPSLSGGSHSAIEYRHDRRIDAILVPA